MFKNVIDRIRHLVQPSSLLVVSIILNVILGLFLFKGNDVFTQKNLSSVKGAARAEFLTAPIQLSGNKEIENFSFSVPPDALKGKDTLSITLDLNGVCLLPAASSLVSFTDELGKKHSTSLHDHVENCANGTQTATIALSSFFGNKTFPNVAAFDVQVWSPTFFAIDIQSISVENKVLGASTRRTSRRIQSSRLISSRIKPTHAPRRPTATLTPGVTITPTLTPSLFPTAFPSATLAPSATPTPFPTATLTPTPTHATNQWSIRSTSSMKETKDRVCNQRDATFITNWVNTAYELGVTHIAVETPYDNPNCGSAVQYTKSWVDAIHAKGLKVWHRHMPLAFEGIYDIPKNSSTNYLSQISSYIQANPTFFREGDIFTPIPEPQNGGIQGITYCPQGICMFTGATHFNAWLRDAITSSENAFSSIGLGGKMRVGYYGFDGFVAWGDNNPDWDGILEDATVAKMGNITIDHYPEIVGDTMENDLNELQAKYPNVPIIIGEWGTITGGDVEQQVRNSMQAAKRPNVIGFNYWHMGTGGNEALVNDDLSKRVHFDEVQGFFR